MDEHKYCNNICHILFQPTFIMNYELCIDLLPLTIPYETGKVDLAV